MFRKPKRSQKKASLRRKVPNNNNTNEEEEEEEDETSRELQQARKRAKTNTNKSTATTSTTTTTSEDDPITQPSSQLDHHFHVTSTNTSSTKDLVTSTTQHHPTKPKQYTNKFLAGPLRAATNIRTTCRFDYQPDICKDYKDTGFCGFGDTCIYLHDRGDTLSGWQLEQEWQQKQQAKKDAQQAQVDQFLEMETNDTTSTKKTLLTTGDDNNNNNNHTLPFACHLCRQAFSDPVVTICGHYYCQTCILTHVRETSNRCPICSQDLQNVFHAPTKLLQSKRRLVGKSSATWQEYLEMATNGSSSGGGGGGGGSGAATNNDT